MRAAGRSWRHALAAAMTGLLVASSMLVGLSIAAAQAASDDTTEEIGPEQYPAPSEPEKTVTPKPQVAQPPELARTGVEVPWTWMAAGGAVLLLAGGGLLVARRRV